MADGFPGPERCSRSICNVTCVAALFSGISKLMLGWLGYGSLEDHALGRSRASFRKPMASGPPLFSQDSGPASGYPPDGKCSCLNCRFNGAQSGLSARAGRDEQNVVAPKCDIRFLSPENILKIHGHLFALSGIGLEPQDLGVPCIGSGERPSARASASSTDIDRKSTRLNSSHGYISYAVFC